MGDEAKLTALALGELGAAERAEVEAWLAGDATARAELEAIEGTIDLLGEALAREAEVRTARRTNAAWWTLALAAAALIALTIGLAHPWEEGARRAALERETATPKVEAVEIHVLAEGPDRASETPQCTAPPDEAAAVTEGLDEQTPPAALLDAFATE